MPRQENLTESPEISIGEAFDVKLEEQYDSQYNRLVEETNLEKKAEMARELLSTGLSMLAVKRILNLPLSLNVFEK